MSTSSNVWQLQFVFRKLESFEQCLIEHYQFIFKLILNKKWIKFITNSKIFQQLLDLLENSLKERKILVWLLKNYHTLNSSINDKLFSLNM